MAIKRRIEPLFNPRRKEHETPEPSPLYLPLALLSHFPSFKLRITPPGCGNPSPEPSHPPPHFANSGDPTGPLHPCLPSFAPLSCAHPLRLSYPFCMQQRRQALRLAGALHIFSGAPLLQLSSIGAVISIASAATCCPAEALAKRGSRSKPAFVNFGSPAPPPST